jgi:MFS transporter, MHS family, proline/betaine transporter
MSYAQPTANHATRHNPSNLLRRAIAASALGNATEWFDYGIYATA